MRIQESRSLLLPPRTWAILFARVILGLEGLSARPVAARASVFRRALRPHVPASLVAVGHGLDRPSGRAGRGRVAPGRLADMRGPGGAGRRPGRTTRTVCRSTTGWPGEVERGKEARRTVQVLTKEKAPRYRRPEGATSYLLASPRTSQAKHLTTTLVQVDPGGEQPIHKHAPEQVYFVLEGSGLMTVGSETQEVGPGVCVFVPADTPPGIRHQGQELLRYFSAAAPAFDTSDLLSTWPLGSESEEAGKDD